MHTAGGTVRARHLLVAGGALLGGSCRHWRASCMSIGTYIATTQPLGEERARALVRNGAAVADMNWILDYFRVLKDTRLLFGGRVSYSGLDPFDSAQVLRKRIAAVFPQLTDVRVEYAWGGYLDITPNRAPHFGRLGPSAYFLQGLSGHGMVISGIAGKLAPARRLPAKRGAIRPVLAASSTRTSPVARCCAARRWCWPCSGSDCWTCCNHDTRHIRLPAWFSALPFLLGAATFTWLLSLPSAKRVHRRLVVEPDVFPRGRGLRAGQRSARAAAVARACGCWPIWACAARPSTSRGATWRHGEDRRYQEIRARNQPGFAGEEPVPGVLAAGALAWVISLPLLGAFATNRRIGWLDYLGIALWLFGFVFEAGGDWQLARFKKDPANADKVMDRGLWRYTRHPNYFGEFCIWWGFWCFALAAGAWWSLPGPLLISFLLLRVSGVPCWKRTSAIVGRGMPTTS